MKKVFRILKSIGIFILASTLLTVGSEFAYEAFDFCLGESDFFDSRVFAATVNDRIAELEWKYPGVTVIDGYYDNDIIYYAICEAIENHDDQLVIYRNTGDIFRNIQKFDAVSDFKYFWLDSWSMASAPDYSIMTFHYLYDEYETERMIEQIDRIHRDIQYDLMYYAGDNEWKVAEYVYNYLVREVTYSTYETPNMRNIYGALVEKRAVCAGYAAAFDYIMSRLGYDVGVAGNGDHIWNYMGWNSCDRFIDVTWGDPDAYNVYSNHYIDFSYMGMNYDEIQALDSHYVGYIYISGRAYDLCEISGRVFGGSTDQNYCDIMGFNAGYYSYERILAILRSQYDLNECSMMVKFDNSSELNSAVYNLTANDNEVLNRILTDLGYHGRYSYHWNEACNTLVINILVP